MTQDFPEFDEQIPLWDVALEALLRDEVMREARALTIDDIVRLGQQYNIRFDDLMVTLLELMLQGQWQYRNTQGEAEQVTREQVNALYVAGRIYPDDMVGFSGSWQPVSGVC